MHHFSEKVLMDQGKLTSHPILKRLIKPIDRGDYLFRQGQMGQTMFIILQGTVELVGEREGKEHIAGVYGPGHFLGEKAIVREAPYQRYLSARAQTDSVVLELGINEMNTVFKEAPAVMGQLVRRSFDVAIHRLDQANLMIHLLRSSDNYERLLQYLIYFCHSSGKKTSEGLEVVIEPESIYYYIDMPVEEIKACMESLVRAKLIIHQKSGSYVIRDENAILQYLPTLTQLREAA